MEEQSARSYEQKELTGSASSICATLPRLSVTSRVSPIRRPSDSAANEACLGSGGG